MTSWLVALTCPSFGADLLVPDDFGSVQAAVGAAALTGDVIIVTDDQDGTIEVDGKSLTINGIGIENVALTSNGNEVLRLINGADVTVRYLTIDGETNRRGIEVLDTSQLTLDAAKIMDGEDTNGAGIDLQDTSGLVSLGTLFCGNVASDFDESGTGGGIRVDDNSTSTITGSVFYDNLAYSRAGGIRHDSTNDGSVATSTFYQNRTTDGRGAAINSRRSDVSIDQCLFVDNDTNCDECTGYAVYDQSSGTFSGDVNLYFGNTGGDENYGGFTYDSFGTDPQLVGGVRGCDTVTMADFTALVGGPAATDGLGAVGVDTDGDGYGLGPDCEPTDATIHPSATEAPSDGIDQNCDGVELCYVDLDDDGYGDPGATTWTTNLSCVGPKVADNDLDCDDDDDTVYGGAAEVVDDGTDQDCDGRDACYQDTDRDGFHDGVVIASNDLDCTDNGEAQDLGGTNDGDCDDTDATSYPGAPDTTGDGIDQDCDGAELCYVDGDNDGSRLTTTVLSGDTDCTDSGEGEEGDPIDCDDSDDSAYPGATELIADGVDQDCDGDELCYVDNDDDGARTGLTTTSTDLDCNDNGEGVPSDPIDCDDTDPAIRPGALELDGDGIDQNCDGNEICYVDADNDEWRVNTTVPSLDADCDDPGEALAAQGLDCDDTDPTQYPGATDLVGDGKDSDCDEVEVCFKDTDNDGYQDESGATVLSYDESCDGDGETTNGSADDCNDDDPNSFPGAAEQCDGQDNDCDGQNDEDIVSQNWWPDTDGDSFGDPLGPPVYDCSAPPNHVADDGDCDDTNLLVSPAMPELCNGIDDNCDGQIDEGWDDVDWWPDTDLDGFGDTSSSPVADCLPPAAEGWVDNDLDCDDGSSSVSPSFPEVLCNGVDDDCDGATPDDPGDGTCDDPTTGTETGDTGVDTTDTGFPTDADTDTDTDSDADTDVDTDTDAPTDGTATDGLLVDEGAPVAGQGCACGVTQAPIGAWVSVVPLFSVVGRRR